ncbi:MAG: hypothetical protein ABJB47_00330 [Actinomycetota bacterium]
MRAASRSRPSSKSAACLDWVAAVATASVTGQSIQPENSLSSSAARKAAAPSRMAAS